jgi:hypothetical protein
MICFRDHGVYQQLVIEPVGGLKKCSYQVGGLKKFSY